jgi:Zn-dependent protease with chaperone function
MVAAETARLQQMDRHAVSREIVSTPALSAWEVEAVAEQIFATAQPLCAREQVTCAVDLVVADESEENAFMDGNGQLTVTNGLLRLIRSRDELAFIMGHEVGHHIADHVDETVMRARAGQVAGLLLGVTVAALTAQADPDLLRQNPDLAALGVAGAVKCRRTRGRPGLLAVPGARGRLSGVPDHPRGGLPARSWHRGLRGALPGHSRRQDGTSFFGTHPGFGERIAHLRQAIAAEQAHSSVAREGCSEPPPAHQGRGSDGPGTQHPSRAWGSPA